MRVIVGLVVAVILLLVLMPLWGMIGALAYGGIAWTGQLLSNGVLTDGRLAFRAGVVIGGTVSVASLLRVGWRDRAWEYAIMAALLAFGFFLLLLATGTSSVRYVPPSRVSQDLMREADLARERGRPMWTSRSGYEREATALLRDIARAAARGNVAVVDEKLNQLQDWAHSRQRAASWTDRDRHEAARQQFGRSTMDAQTAAERKASSEERIALLTTMWDAVPDVDTGGVQRLLLELIGLNHALRARMADSVDADEPALSIDDQVRGILTLQEALLSYKPSYPALWDSYAAVVVDVDEELALGALLVAARLKQGEREGSPRSEPLDLQGRLLARDLSLQAIWLPESSRKRLEILQARAEVLQLPRRGAAGDDANGARRTSEQVLPAAQSATTGRGLNVVRYREQSPLAPPAATSPSRANGEVFVDLPAAGFEAMVQPIALPVSGVRTNARLQLVIDVLADGTLSSVLVEESTGDAALDTRAREEAARWTVSDRAPKAGERRRVEVLFTVSPTVADGRVEQATLLPGASSRDFLATLLRDKARTKPARYPPASAREGLEGRVLLAITLSGDGQVKRVRITESSGNRLLDAAAREAALGWSVAPGMATSDVDEVTLDIPVTFRLQ